MSGFLRNLGFTILLSIICSPLFSRPLTEQEIQRAQSTLSLAIDKSYPLTDEQRELLGRQIATLLANLMISTPEEISPAPKLPFDVEAMKLEISQSAPQLIPFDLRGHVADAISRHIAARAGQTGYSDSEKESIRWDATVTIPITEGPAKGRSYVWKLPWLTYGTGDKKVRIMIKKGWENMADQILVNLPDSLFSSDPNDLSFRNALGQFYRGLVGVVSETVGLKNLKPGPKRRSPLLQTKLVMTML